MTDFDRKIRELSRNVNIPDGYDERVKEVLRKIPDSDDEYVKKNRHISKRRLAIVFSFICVFIVLGGFVISANASIFDSFKMTIMDILNIEKDDEQIGVEVKNEQIESKHDLFLELQQVVTDNQGVYLLVKITAPTDISFTKEISFDYFAFCEGDNYNADKLIGGGKDCYLLETLEGKPNVATYIVNLTADMEEFEGKNITAYFKDLTFEPNGENPQLLVEGMWSITFVSELTVKQSVVIEGNADMVFPFVDTTAAVEHIEVTPLGLTLVSDVSKFPYEDLGITDTTISVRLKMIDGSEINIMPYNPEEEWIVDSGNTEYIQEGEKTFKNDIYSFTEAIDVTRIAGIYIQDLYVPAQ